MPPSPSSDGPPVSGQQKIGSYTLRRRLGEGGMGVVWLAHDPDLDREVAIKEMILPTSSDGSNAKDDDSADRNVQRFLREARAAAKLSHPHCVAVYHITRQADRLYIVMEYVDGGSFTDLLRCEGRVPWRNALRMIREAALGLGAAHDAGLVHRDVKPSNLLLATQRGSTQPVVKVADFGLARAAGLGGSDVTLPGGGLIGTPAYMSPEQCRGDEASIDGRGDLYSLVCTLYTLITGLPPYPDPSVAVLVHKHLSEPLPDARRMVPDVPDALIDLLRRGTEKDVSRRYQSARELVAAIDSITEISPASAAAAAATVIVPVPPPHVPSGSSATLAPDAADAPPTAKPFPSNLPQAVTSFIGRQRELAEAEALLLSGPTRLLTLTGTGGTGKTRLALTLAHRLAQPSPSPARTSFTDGVWWVELAPIAQAGLVAQTIASALGMHEARDLSATVALGQFVRDKSMLIVLDNCEHLIDATARVCDELLRACPNLRILASSRQPLSIEGETTLRVPSLGVPESDASSSRTSSKTSSPQQADMLMRSEAVQLFAERAVAAQRSFRLDASNVGTVADICRRVDGIPLAIELAAARVKVLSVEQIAQRLADRFKLLVGGSRVALPRQQTLRALVDWSYELLDERERTLLARLAVFHGGFMLDAAEGACVDDHGAILAPEQILDILGSLVDKSLVLAEEQPAADGETVVRYRMLETLRAYATEKLRATEGALDHFTARHARWVADFARDMGPKLLAADSERYVWRLNAEHDNVRAALEWCAAHGDGVSGVAIVAGLGRYWYRRGFLQEGITRCRAILSLPSAATRNAERAEALTWAGVLELNYDNPERAVALHREALEIARELGDARTIALAANYLGNASRTVGDYATALACYEESLALVRQLGDKAWLARTTGNMANVCKDLGRVEQAQRLLDECLALHREMGDVTMLGWTLLNFGDLELYRGRAREAIGWFEQARAKLREVKDVWSETYAMEGLGRARFLLGEDNAARTILNEAIVLLREFGDHSYIAIVQHTLADLALREGNVDDARRSYAESLGIRRKIREIWSQIASIEAIARMLMKTSSVRDDMEIAVRLFGAADATRCTTNVAMPLVDVEQNRAAMEVARRALGETEYELAFRAGAGLDLAGAGLLALGVVQSK